MSTRSQRPTSVYEDPAVPAEDLLGDGATALLEAAVGAAGGTVLRHAPTQSNYHPGRSLRVAHDVTVRWADDRTSTETMVLAAGRTPPDGSLVFNDGTHDVTVWQLPHDPWLPGMAPAVDPARIGPLLREIGYEVDPAELRTRLRAYRPGRRAVVEVIGSGIRIFVKVVRPEKARALRDRHELLASTAPTPQVLGWAEEQGMVILQALPGRTLGEALAGGFGLPGPSALLRILDDLPEPEAPAEDVTPSWRADEFADLIGTTVPALADRVKALASALAPYQRRAGEEPVVAVHGDYYEAQLLVDGGSIVGLLDVDTFGWGRRVEDLANLIGHLTVVASEAEHGPAVARYAQRLLDRFDLEVDPALLRAAVAGVVLGLATGSFRVLDPGWQLHTARRVELAEAWLASADEAAAKALTATAHAPVTEAAPTMREVSSAPHTALPDAVQCGR